MGQVGFRQFLDRAPRLHKCGINLEFGNVNLTNVILGSVTLYKMLLLGNVVIEMKCNYEV